ncbi:MAG: aminopeptidase, partial [Phycisphaeraceae bacterium]|nr:aminopeptidase [Phycisphaeraceae bacterium]
MRDPRLAKLAQVLVHYSTGVKPGQLVRISGEPVATPLIEAIYEEVIKAGAHGIARCGPESLRDIFFEFASDEQLKFVDPLALHETNTINVSIGIWADVNTKHLSRIDPAKQKLASAARHPILTTFLQRAQKGELKWSGTQYPTAASAQDAEMSLRQYEDFVFRAGYLHTPDPVAEWRKIEVAQQKVVDYLKGKKIVRFRAANGTDLSVNVEGMTWINCCGHENFPDGEVFTGPNLKAADGGVNGLVRYSFPTVHHGQEVDGVELRLEKGRVVEAKASKGQGFLLSMLDQDAGARSVGEIALGTNYQVQECTKNTLFDEKIGGTFHMAVGAGYPETGNSNESG